MHISQTYAPAVSRTPTQMVWYHLGQRSHCTQSTFFGRRPFLRGGGSVSSQRWHVIAYVRLCLGGHGLTVDARLHVCIGRGHHCQAGVRLTWPFTPRRKLYGLDLRSAQSHAEHVAVCEHNFYGLWPWHCHGGRTSPLRHLHDTQLRQTWEVNARPGALLDCCWLLCRRTIKTLNH